MNREELRGSREQRSLSTGKIAVKAKLVPQVHTRVAICLNGTAATTLR
jgi:hypothetical protein